MFRQVVGARIYQVYFAESNVRVFDSSIRIALPVFPALIALLFPILK
jgi:hypothetical protein